ncbi:MAG: hypothetical protein AAGG48_31525 [Planctomycetota bacterium]
MIDSVPSWLERLDNHEPSALPMLFNESRAQELATLVDQWVERKSAWAVSEQVRYFQAGIVPRGHRVVVRRLIRAAAKNQHDRVMAAAMVFADYLRDTSAFTFATTAYLQRFTWRYMRTIAGNRPDDYCKALAAALRAYPSTMSESDIMSLRRWCLLKACFGKNRSLRFTSTGVNVTANIAKELAKSRGEMAYAELWHAPSGQSELNRLIVEARSPFLRTWAKNQLR